jgi:hypothetical protein
VFEWGGREEYGGAEIGGREGNKLLVVLVVECFMGGS